MRNVSGKRVQLAFTEYARQIYNTYIYEKSTVRLTSVGLAQARPNYISAVRTYSVNASSTLLTRTLRTPIRAGEKSKTMQVL